MQKRRNFKFIGPLALFVLLFAVNLFFDGIIQNSIYRLFAFPFSVINTRLASTSEYLKGFANIGKLVKDNEELQRRVDKLVAQQILDDELKRENDMLREQLNVDRSNFTLETVNIIDVQRSPQSSKLIINAGKNENIAEGMAVIASGNILAGVVKEVYADTSRVSMIDDNNFSVSVKIRNSSVIGKTVGKNNDKFSVDLIGSKEDVVIGNNIITSGLDGLPNGLYVGNVISIDNNEEDLFLNITAENAFNLSFGPELFIVTNEQ